MSQRPVENESVFFSGLPPPWTCPSATCSQPPTPSFTFRADSSDLAATLVQLPTAAGTGHCKSNASSGDGMDESRFLHACSGTRKGTSLQRAKAFMGHRKEAVTACRKDAFRWRNICQDVHPVQLLPRVGVSVMALYQGQGENLPVCRAGPMGPRCQTWPNGKKFLQNANTCENIRFGLLCADTHVGMWKKALAALGMGPVQPLHTRKG